MELKACRRWAALVLAFALALAAAALSLPARAFADTPDYLTIDEDAKTITVSPSDSDDDNEIQDALDYLDSLAEGTTDDSEGAEDGWTITVTAGTYSRFTVYNTLDNLTIQAADGAEVIISVLDGSDAPATTSGAYPETGGVSIRDCEYVVLDGLTFKAGSAQSSPWYAAAVSTTVQTTEKAISPTIRNCTFIGVGSNYGYFSDNIESWTIENCTFNNFSGAIEFYGDNITSGTVSVTGNTFTSCSFAIHGYTNGGSMSFTNNIVTGSSSLRCKIVLQDQYSSGNLTVNVSGNTLTNAMIGLVNVSAYSVEESSAEALKAANTLDENSYVVVATNDEGEDYSTIYFSPESSHGYWALTNVADNDDLDVSWGGNAEGTDDYVKSVIDAANEDGSHTLSFSVMDDDLIKTFTWFKDAIYWVGSDEDEEEPSVTKSVDKEYVVAGDEVTFTLTVSAPKYLEIYGTTSNYDSIIRYPEYVEYDVTVHDTMDSVLTMNDDIVVSVNGAAIAESYYEVVTATDDGCDFEVVIDYAALLDDGILVADSDGAYSDVIVTYSATVADDAENGDYDNTTWVSYEADGKSDKSTATVKVRMVDVTVSKVWDDGDDEDGIRPDSVTVALYADGEDTGLTVELSEENDWTATFEKLAAYAYDADGNATEIAYAIAETDVPEGYVVTYSAFSGSIAEGGYSITVTNAHEVTAEQESDEETLAATGDSTALAAASIAGMGALALAAGAAARRRKRG